MKYVYCIELNLSFAPICLLLINNMWILKVSLSNHFGLKAGIEWMVHVWKKDSWRSPTSVSEHIWTSIIITILNSITYLMIKIIQFSICVEKVTNVPAESPKVGYFRTFLISVTTAFHTGLPLPLHRVVSFIIHISYITPGIIMHSL